MIQKRELYQERFISEVMANSPDDRDDGQADGHGNQNGFVTDSDDFSDAEEDTLDESLYIARQQQNSMNCDKSDLSPHLSCGEISTHDKFVSTFFHMTDLSPYLPCGNIQLTICYVENFSLSQSAMWRKFLQKTDCHVEKFSI